MPFTVVVCKLVCNVKILVRTTRNTGSHSQNKNRKLRIYFEPMFFFFAWSCLIFSYFMVFTLLSHDFLSSPKCYPQITVKMDIVQKTNFRQTGYCFWSSSLQTEKGNSLLSRQTVTHYKQNYSRGGKCRQLKQRGHCWVARQPYSSIQGSWGHTRGRDNTCGSWHICSVCLCWQWE